MTYTHEEKTPYDEYLKLSKYSENTKKIYLMYYKLFQQKGYDFEQINIDRFLAQHNNGVCRAFLKSLLSHYEITNIKIVPIKGRKRKKIVSARKFLSPQEIKVISENLPEKEGFAIRLMFETGLRLTELMNLTKYDIDLANLYVRGIGKGNKEFELPFSKKLAQDMVYFLDGYADEENPFKYPEVKHSDKKFWYILKKWGKNNNYLLDNSLRPHRIRHSLGYFLRAEKGFDLEQIRTQLRHEALETVKIYASAQKEEVEAKMRSEVFGES